MMTFLELATEINEAKNEHAKLSTIRNEAIEALDVARAALDKHEDHLNQLLRELQVMLAPVTPTKTPVAAPELKTIIMQGKIR